MIHFNQHHCSQITSIFDGASCISELNEDNRMFFKDNSIDPQLCFDQSEHVKSIFDYNLGGRWECSDDSNQINACRNFDL